MENSNDCIALKQLPSLRGGTQSMYKFECKLWVLGAILPQACVVNEFTSSHDSVSWASGAYRVLYMPAACILKVSSQGRKASKLSKLITISI